MKFNSYCINYRICTCCPVKYFRLTYGYNLVGMMTYGKLVLRGRKQVSLPSKRLYGNTTLEVYDAYLLLIKC